MNYIKEYYKCIEDGSVVVGEYVRQIYELLSRWLDDGTVLYDEKKANAAVDWIEKHFHHTEGPKAPDLIELELWQKAIIASMFGLVDKNGLRQFREVVVIIGRKNGKSLLASAIASYIFFVDGGFGTRVYNIAPKLDQAEIIYNNIWQNIALSPSLLETKDNKEDGKPRARHRMTDLFIQNTNSTVKKIAFSAKRSDGFNPSFCICDEIASWQGDGGLKQYEVMKSGMGARPEGILFSCSTAGYLSNGIFDELVLRSTRFLKGDSKETKLLPFLYMIDDVEKWNDLTELRKSNPNLGVSVSDDYMKEEIAIAEGSLSKKAEFMCKYCNIKQNSSQAWLDTTTVDRACGEELSLEDFRGCYCVGGIDLSMTTDLTSCCAVIEKNNNLYVFSKFFLPSEKIDEAIARDGLPYRAYIQRGLLEPSGENFNDYKDCMKFFVDLIEKYSIYPLKIGYDRYSSQYLVQDMRAYGFHMDDVFQGENLTPVIREFEGTIKDGLVHIGDNDLLKIHLLNSAMKLNAENSRMRLIKISQNEHVDGCAALLDAFCVRQKYFNEIGEQLRNEVM